MDIVLGVFPLDLFSDVSVSFLVQVLVLDSYSSFTLYSLIYDFVLVHSFIHSKIFNALCPLIELISDVVDVVGTPTDINGDGCFTDDAGFFGTMLSVTPVGLIGW